MKRLLPLLLLAGCSRPDPAVLDAGREAWVESCSNCHFVPDPSIRFDRVWMAMIDTTT